MAVDRFHACQGDTVRLMVKFHRPDGSLYDPSSISKVEILDKDTLAVVDTVLVGITQQAVGYWYIDWAIPGAQAVGTYLDKWYYTPDAGGTERDDSAEFVVHLAGTFAPATTYLSVASVKSDCIKPLADWPAGTYPTDTAIQEAIVAATEIIEGICQRSFIAEETTITVDGTGRPYLWPYVDGHEYRMLRVDSISIDGTAVDMDDVVVYPTVIVNKYYDKDDLRETSLCIDYPCGDDLTLCSTGGSSTCFTKGRKNITITGRFGDYDSLPTRVENLCCRITHNILEEEWGAFTPFESETLGD